MLSPPPTPGTPRPPNPLKFHAGNIPRDCPEQILPLTSFLGISDFILFHFPPGRGWGATPGSPNLSAAHTATGIQPFKLFMTLIINQILKNNPNPHNKQQSHSLRLLFLVGLGFWGIFLLLFSFSSPLRSSSAPLWAIPPSKQTKKAKLFLKHFFFLFFLLISLKTEQENDQSQKAAPLKLSKTLTEKK